MPLLKLTAPAPSPSCPKTKSERNKRASSRARALLFIGCDKIPDRRQTCQQILRWQADVAFDIAKRANFDEENGNKTDYIVVNVTSHDQTRGHLALFGDPGFSTDSGGNTGRDCPEDYGRPTHRRRPFSNPGQTVARQILPWLPRGKEKRRPRFAGLHGRSVGAARPQDFCEGDQEPPGT